MILDFPFGQTDSVPVSAKQENFLAAVGSPADSAWPIFLERFRKAEAGQKEKGIPFTG